MVLGAVLGQRGWNFQKGGFGFLKGHIYRGLEEHEKAMTILGDSFFLVN